MPVETIEFVNRSRIEEFFHFFFREEMARHIELKAAVAKLWGILNGQIGQCPS